jgi:hypothetical protein
MQNGELDLPDSYTDNLAFTEIQSSRMMLKMNLDRKMKDLYERLQEETGKTED